LLRINQRRLLRTAVALVALVSVIFATPAPAQASVFDWLRQLFGWEEPVAQTRTLPIRVSTTTTILADLVRNVGGDRVRVTSVVPLNGDPHTFDPTPRDARAVTAAEILFVNGLGLELWSDRLVRSTARRDLIVATLSDGLTARPGASFSTHMHDEGDPHFWLDVKHAIYYVNRIEKELTSLDPAGARHYAANSERYRKELRELDVWFRDQVQQIPASRRKLVTYHDAFGYMADAYGFELVGFLVRNPDREPSARDMARLVDQMRDLGVRAVFAEPQINPKFAQALAQEAGVRVGILYSDSLTSSIPTYVEMMRYNARALVGALR